MEADQRSGGGGSSSRLRRGGCIAVAPGNAAHGVAQMRAWSSQPAGEGAATRLTGETGGGVERRDATVASAGKSLQISPGLLEIHPCNFANQSLFCIAVVNHDPVATV